MRIDLPLTLLLAIATCLCACQGEATTPPAADTAVLAPTIADASAEPANSSSVADSGTTGEVAATESTQVASGEFDPTSVAESTASLPPFPFFKEPEGLTSTFDDKDRRKNFDREHMIAGDRIVAVEGKVFRDRFQLTNPDQREYSEIEFHRNYADAVAALGGTEVSRVQYLHKVNEAFGGREVTCR